MGENTNLKVARAKKDMTQRDLAAEIGVSPQTNNAMEKGDYIRPLIFGGSFS